VKGPEKELHAAAHDFGGHALALTLLATYLVELHDSDVRRRDRIRGLLADAEIKEHDHAVRVFEAYDKEWFNLFGARLRETFFRVIGNQKRAAEFRQLRLMRATMLMIGLFDRPASAECIAALGREPNIAGFSEPLVEATDEAFKHAVNRLRAAGLLLAEDEQAPGSLDAHPLAREWYGEKFKRENEVGFKAAHGRLYEHLRDTTEEGDPPKEVAALEPLFQAIAHGCKAERRQETLDEVYVKRICRRGQDGRLAFHAEFILGAIGPCLAALAWFFDRSFQTPHAGLEPAHQSWVLGNAAASLGFLGRLGEACGAQRTALKMAIAAKDWCNGAIVADNLSEAELALGDITAAVRDAAGGVQFADASKDEFEMLLSRAKHAAALVAAGDAEGARALFVEAEARQESLQPQYLFLYRQQGALYCDLLIDDLRLIEVAKRATQTLAWGKGRYAVLDIGLDEWNLGRAALGMALSAVMRVDAARQGAEACAHFEVALVELRRSSQAIYVPLGHLARARLPRAEGDFTAAKRDLDEVLEIASASSATCRSMCDGRRARPLSRQREKESFAAIDPAASRPSCSAQLILERGAWRPLTPRKPFSASKPPLPAGAGRRGCRAMEKGSPRRWR